MTFEARAISDEVRDIHTAAYERPLTGPVVTDIGDLQVTCRLAFALCEADEVLITHGLHDSVHEARAAFAATMSSALSAAVERATGRRVVRHTSQTDLHERATTETFDLLPTG